MVFDPCMGPGATAKTCLMERQHHKYTGCDRDGACIKKMIPSLLKTFTSQILNEDFGIVKNAEVENSSRLYL